MDLQLKRSRKQCNQHIVLTIKKIYYGEKTIIWTDSFDSFAGEISFSIEQKGKQRYLVISQRKAEIEGDPENPAL